MSETAIKPKNLQRRSITTPKKDTMAEKRCLICTDNQKDIPIISTTMKTTTKRGENQNSAEKCEKKMSKPLNPLAFLQKIYL